MTLKLRPFNAADYFDDEESQNFLLKDAVASGDPSYIANALGTIARAKGGLAHLERRTGIKRQTLNKSLGKSGNPTLGTLLPVLEALGLKMTIKPRQEKEAA